MRGGATGDLAAWNELATVDLDRNAADLTAAVAAAAAERQKDAMVSRNGGRRRQSTRAQPN
jgi:hypothetical protein